MSTKKRNIVIPAILIMITGIFSFKNFQQGSEPWRQDQLIEPSALAAILNDSSAKQPLTYSIGFGGGIKNSIVEGPVKDSANLLKWKNELENLPRNTNIVIYCGCCPWEACPNVRPAIDLLHQLGYQQVKALVVSSNLEADWGAKGYPLEKGL